MVEPVPPRPAPTGTQFAMPVAIINPMYYSRDPVDLTSIKMVFMTISNGNFVVKDINENVTIFKVKRAFLTLRDRHLLIDAAENPIVTFQEKIFSAHQRWKVFRGESDSSKDLLFSVKRSLMTQLKANLNVFLANNMEEDDCNFRVEDNLLGSSFTIYAGDVKYF
ncbi:Protein LURP-one-related 15 [Morella rubra]|uniref:Protein LURP-one-related 15 n=1 Tax=Morella rubra TaxID=262757 RepID=A0A6A1WH25_9ROSI|nr:Protein LURP-one-related 15 [Morella rubra]